MGDVEQFKVSYKELREYVNNNFDDKYRILSDYLTPNVRKALLSNPNLSDKTKSALNLIILDGTIVGRNMLMPTQLKVGDRYITVQSGGSYEVNDAFRGRGFGSVAFEDSIINSEYDAYIGQLYSTTAIKIVRKLGLIIFELPTFYKLCNSRSILESKGLSGLLLNICTVLANTVIKAADIPNAFKLKAIKRKYKVKKVDVVPIWVNDITLHDDHCFTEVHDVNWLQWCLDNRFTDSPQDKQSFYVVYGSDNNPKGFFMTKERYEESQGNYKKVTRGTIVEWGSINEEELSEYDMNLLATYSFGKKVDNITTVLSNPIYSKKLKKLGYFSHGNYQMTIKPGNLNRNDITDQSKWRIRYGGCNTIIF